MQIVLLALLLSQVPGIGNKRLSILLQRLRREKPFPPDWGTLASLLQSQAGLAEVPSQATLVSYLKRAESMMEALEAMEVKVLTFGEPDFPDRLARIPDPPALLFCRGEIAALHAQRVVAVVGTREPTGYGKASSHRIGRLLGERGVAVVSGLALGCDAFAHEGCVEAGGQTVAVLAHGLHTVYPAANRDLAERILAGKGCLVSEYPPGTPPYRVQFVRRDRLQIGMADFLVLIESDTRGGAMHTVHFCLDQGKPLGCVLHPDKYLVDAKTRGNQELLRSGKAVPIADAPDLLEFVRFSTKAEGTDDDLKKTASTGENLVSWQAEEEKAN